MNFPSLRHVLLKLYFPAAFLFTFVLLVLDATTPPVVAQVRTVTVTQTVRVVVTATVTQQIYVTLDRTVMVTVATRIPTTFTSVMTSVVSRLVSETLLTSRLVTETVSVRAPIRIGPLSLDLADAGGLRFLAYTGARARTGRLYNRNTELYWKTLDATVEEYIGHPESKFENGDKIGRMKRKRLLLEENGIKYIGKESNELEESEVLGVLEDQYVEYGCLGR